MLARFECQALFFPLLAKMDFIFRNIAKIQTDPLEIRRLPLPSDNTHEAFGP